MDEVQYDYDDGPCLSASREQRTVHVVDLQDETRWPAYAKDALGRGVRSILAVPFTLESGDHAALNLYSEQPDDFDAEAISRATEYADQASQALRLARHRDTEENLTAAMQSRTTIDLTVGIIMGQSQCSQEEAFAILRSASSTRNIKLRNVAAGIVGSTGTGPAHTHFDR